MAASKMCRNTFTILQWNCRGIHNKIDELKQTIAQRPTDPDIIALQETNLRQHHSINIPGYHKPTRVGDPKNNKTGAATGILIAVNKKTFIQHNKYSRKSISE